MSACQVLAPKKDGQNRPQICRKALIFFENRVKIKKKGGITVFGFSKKKKAKKLAEEKAAAEK
ncbi:MAG: hypothetical protein J6A84_02040, partial [Clostridia bacterium]|nr:hypothetical protein [Clostridia bacterium]